MRQACLEETTTDEYTAFVMTDLSLTFARRDGQVLVKIAGELDGYTAGQVSDALVGFDKSLASPTLPR